MDPYSLAISAGLSTGEGLLKHSLGKRANRKFAASRDAAKKGIPQQAATTKGRIRRETSQVQAQTRNNLARRGLDSTSVYDSVVNDALDRQFRAEAEIDANVGTQIAQLIANSPDPYDGNALYAGLAGVAKAAGTYMGSMDSGKSDGLGGGGRQSGDTENQSLAAMSGVLDPMKQTPGGGPAILPGGGTQVSSDQFSASSGQFPGQTGFSPYGALLDQPDELEMDGAPKPRKRQSAVQSAYASAY